MFSAPFNKVLNELKVSATNLNDSERKGLDEKGFVVNPNHLPHSLREQLIETVVKYIFGRRSCRRNTEAE